MKRVAVGQLLQETNSLNPRQTQLADFEAYGLAQGQEVMARYGQVGELAGFAALPELAGEEVEWVGLVRAAAWSGGMVAEGVLDRLIGRAIEPLREIPVDGVLFSLHGAQAAVEEPDATGRVLERLRAAVGPGVPVVATLDLHANVTGRMVHHADVLAGYHTFPHVDHVECGRRAARALAQLLRPGRQARKSAYKVPMVVNTDGRATDLGVQAALWRRLEAADRQPGVLAAGLYMVQPWFDVPELGWTLYQAYLDGQPPLDPEAVSRECWDTRHYRRIRFLRPEEVVPAALGIPGRPVAVSESHDATNSGAPGDSTLLLEALVRTPVPGGGSLSFCVDPEAVARCRQAGSGAWLEFEVGGKWDPYSGPLTVRAQVLRLARVEYLLSGHGGHNLPVDMGHAAVVRAGDATVVLTEKTGPGSSPGLYESAGLDPRQFKIVVAKSPEGFRRDYEPFAAGILYCGAPGCATPHLEQVGFSRVSRPVFPLDDLQDMGAAGWAGELSRGG